VHLGVEWPGLSGVAKVWDRFRVPSLPRDGDPEVERSIGILRTTVER
jgi:hypothetical protein